MKRLLIIGAGGFGQMIQETAGLLGYEEVVFLDDASKHKDVVGKCCDYRNFKGLRYRCSSVRRQWTEALLD